MKHVVVILVLALAGGLCSSASATEVPARWHVAWDTLAAPSDTAFLYRQPLRPLLQLWGADGEARPAQGKASYAARLTRRDAAAGGADGLLLPDLYTSYRLFANGVEIASNGEVGTGPRDNVPAWRELVARLPPGDTVDLLLHIANYHHARGGAAQAWTLGAYDELVDKQHSAYLYAAFVAALYLLGALVMLGTYRLYRENRAALFFAGACVAIFYRVVGSGTYLLHDIFPGLPYWLTLRLEYASYYLTCWLYWEFADEIVGRRMPKLLLRVQRAWHSAMVGLVALTPDVFFTGLLPLGHIAIGASVIYGAFLLTAWVREDWRGRCFAYASFAFIILMAIVTIAENSVYFSFPRPVLPVLIATQIMLVYLHLNGEARDHLREVQRAAVAASSAKSAFLATMSHEIRTPMNGVLGMTSLLSDTELSVEQRQYVDTIRMSGQNLITIINDVLDFSKVDAGKMTLELQPVCLHRVLKDTAALVEGNALQKGLKLALQLDGDLSGALFETDPTRVSQIVTNLLSNAVKFTDAGRVTLRFSGHETETGYCVRIDVADTGIGMSEAQVRGLFRSFSQADASISRRYGGTGLGLAISRKIARLLGGDIEVESIPGVGTTFTCLLPMRRLGEEAPAIAHPEVPAAAASTITAGSDEALPPLRILVAEDHPVNQRLIGTILRKWGYEPDLVGDGREAIDAIDRQAYDLIFMDMQMPVCDGLTATREIRRRHAAAEVRIVALTANAQASDRAACLAAGMQDFIAKPFRPKEIREVITNMAASVA